jgi:flagellar biosynthesis/type III secretory pathway chaperone
VKSKIQKIEEIYRTTVVAKTEIENVVSHLFRLNQTIFETLTETHVTQLEANTNELLQSVTEITNRVDQLTIDLEEFKNKAFDRTRAVKLFQPKLELAKRQTAKATYGIDVPGSNQSVTLGSSANQICWLESFFIRTRYIRDKHDPAY